MSRLMSFVVPVYNEEKSLEILYDKILENMPDEYETEIIFVNDGSTDQSATVIKEIIAKDKRVHLISFLKNFGKAMALES